MIRIEGLTCLRASVGPRRLDLWDGGSLGHEDRGRNAEFSCTECDALSVIAGRSRDNAS